MSLRFLVADCEPAAARHRRRASIGQSAGESFADLLERLEPGCETAQAHPADGSSPDPAAFDAVFLSGSPLHIYDGSAEANREIDWMRGVFASGTPSFGSCAGLQVAAAAAGGIVRPAGPRREAGFARAIWLTPEGAAHPLMRGRPPAFTALTMHGDEVAKLPDGALLLAGNGLAAVQAAEIRHGNGIFWGVQYHPELNLAEIGAALRRDADELVEAGLARERSDITAQAEALEQLSRDPSRLDLRWRLGVDDQVVHDEPRRREIRNFIDHFTRPDRR